MSSAPTHQGNAEGLPVATPMPRPDLQSVIPHVDRLVRGISALDPAVLSLEVQDTLDALLPQLDQVHVNRAAGDIGIGNALMCGIACDAAYLVAAIVSPGEPFDLDTLPSAARGAFDVIKVKLYRLGLMDDYFQGGGSYGIWPKGAA